MTNREKELLALIRTNPLVTQQELASQLGIERSSIAVHISNLIKKGAIKGKGYILEEEPYVVVIGGTNMDIVGKSNNPLTKEDSNPGQVSLSPGGVGRNIAENLALLDIPVKFLTAIGNDLYGDQIVSGLAAEGIDTHYIKRVSEHQTSTYLSVLDDDGSMTIAIADMSISKHINKTYIDNYKKLIENAAFIVIDTNIETDVLHYTLETFKDNKFIVDTVSTTKSTKIRGLFHHLYAIKPNKIEAAKILDRPLNTDAQLEKALLIFKEQGINYPMISMGKEGVAYLDNNCMAIYKPKEVEVINANGAGDAFTAGLCFGFYHNLDYTKTIPLGAAAARVALESSDTVNHALNVERLLKSV